MSKHKQKSNQQGLAPVIIVIGVIAVLGLGTVAYTQLSSNGQENADTTSQQAEGKEETLDSENADEATAAEDKDESADSSDEKTNQDSQPSGNTTNSGGDSSGGSTEEEPKTVDQEAEQLKFTKGGGSQQGDFVVVSSNLSKNVTGTCTFTFSLNGEPRVEEVKGISGNVCSHNIPVSKFPKSAKYDYSLTFISDDGKSYAAQQPFKIEVK